MYVPIVMRFSIKNMSTYHTTSSRVYKKALARGKTGHLEKQQICHYVVGGHGNGVQRTHSGRQLVDVLSWNCYELGPCFVFGEGYNLIADLGVKDE